MNTEKMNLPTLFALFITSLFPLLFFSWWSPRAEHAFAVILCFFLLWVVYWTLFFLVDITPVEAVNFLIKEVQGAVLGADFLLSVGMLLLDVKLRNCLYVTAFVYALFALAGLIILLQNADLIEEIRLSKKGEPLPRREGKEKKR